MASRPAHRSPPLRLLAEAGLLAAAGAAVLLDARGYPLSLAEGAPGPAFFPRLLAALLIACAAWLAIRAWRGTKKRGSGGAKDSGSDAGSGGGSGAGEPLASQARRTRSRGNAASDSAADAKAGTRIQRLGVWIAVTWIAAFLLAWPRLGTVLSVPLLVAGLMWLTGERSWRTLVSVPLAFAGFIYLVFMVLLGVPLPAGF